uniref:ShKT domain-containing protein n=1 Tax=Ascaris lumbricoides TaxID=6252 RepID=A0A9J2PPT7_ASCLU
MASIASSCLAIILLHVNLHSSDATEVKPVDETCADHDRHCFEWVAANARDCLHAPYVKMNCRKTCDECGTPDKRFDVRNMPEVLRPIAFLLGIWRSEAGGKAIFPTIPIFTYGEQVEISLPDSGMRALKALNYTLVDSFLLFFNLHKTQNLTSILKLFMKKKCKFEKCIHIYVFIYLFIFIFIFIFIYLFIY